MRISDWSSDVCSSDLSGTALLPGGTRHGSTRADRSYQSRMRAANSCRVSMVSEVWTLTPRLWHGGAHGERRERRDARPQGEGEDGGEENGAHACLSTPPWRRSTRARRPGPRTRPPTRPKIRISPDSRT